MSQYHFSPQTNAYSVCTAAPGNCPYGSAKHISGETYRNITSGKIYDRPQNQKTDLQLRIGDNRYAKPGKVKVAPEGISGVYCHSCGKYLPNDFTEKILNGSSRDKNRCPHCKAITTIETAGVDIRASEAKYLQESEVRKASWFHVTTNPNWHSGMSSKNGGETPLVHIGSREAALDRMRDMRKWQNDGSQWYLYELKVNPESTVNNGVFEDENDFCPSTVQAARNSDYDGSGVNRYLNVFEGPGTISLVANPRALRQVARVEIPNN